MERINAIELSWSPPRVLGELVLVTSEEVIEHADDDPKVLEAAQRYEERRTRRHERLRAALRPYGDRTTSVEEALRPGGRGPGDRGRRARLQRAGQARGGGLGIAGRLTSGGAVHDRRCPAGARVTPAARWTTDELARRALLEQGVAVAVNLRHHHNLIAWAKERGLFARVDRATPWGNPFELGRDGNRATVIAAYRDHYLPFKPSLLVRLASCGARRSGVGARRWRVTRTCSPRPLQARRAWHRLTGTGSRHVTRWISRS